MPCSGSERTWGTTSRGRCELEWVVSMHVSINGQPYGDLTELHLLIEVAENGEEVGPFSLVVIGGGPLIVKGRAEINDGIAAYTKFDNRIARLPEKYPLSDPTQREARILLIGARQLPTGEV